MECRGISTCRDVDEGAQLAGAGVVNGARLFKPCTGVAERSRLTRTGVEERARVLGTGVNPLSNSCTGPAEEARRPGMVIPDKLLPGAVCSGISCNVTADVGQLISGCTGTTEEGRLSTPSALNPEPAVVEGLASEAGSGVAIDSARSFGVETDEGPDSRAELSNESPFITDFNSFAVGP